MLARAAAFVSAVVVVMAPPPQPSTLSANLRHVLTSDLKFSTGELADLERGEVVRHGLDVSDGAEVAAVGAVRVRTRKDRLVEGYRDIEHFKRGPEVLQIGRFSSPPVMADLDALTIDSQDADFRTCRVHDCDVRLPADAIARMQRDVDWHAPDADVRAAALFKQMLFEDVRAYMTGSPGRFTQYDDDPRPVRPLDEFVSMLNHSPYIGRVLPGLDAHLRDFPSSPVPGAEDIVYWSKEAFGLAPFITVTHITITHDADGDDVLTSKDVYSSRYLDASLTFTIASDAAGSPEAFYLVYVNRSRANALKGAFAALRRGIVKQRARSSLAESLKTLKRRLETP